MLEFWTGYELDFAIDILVSWAAGFIIGAEREARGKAAGISTNCFVIGGSMIFTYLSAAVDPNSNSSKIDTTDGGAPVNQVDDHFNDLHSET